MAKGGSRILIRLAILMVVVMLAAWGAATYHVKGLPDTYRARALLIHAPMPFEQKDETTDNAAVVLETARAVPFTKVGMLESLPMPDYKLLLTSEEVLAKLRDQMRKSCQEAGFEAGNITLEGVSRALEVRIKVHLQTVKEIRYQQVVELLVTAKHPKVAADVANAWAELGIEIAERMRTIAREGAVEFVQQQYDAVWEEYQTAQKGIETLEREWNPEAMKQRLAALESKSTAAQLRHLGLASSETAGQPAKREAIEKELSALEPPITALRTDLARVIHERADLDLQVKNCSKAIEDLSMSLQAAKMAANDLFPEFKIASRALPPEERSGPRRSLIVMATVLLAAALVPIIFFGWTALRRYVRTIEAEETSPAA